MNALSAILGTRNMLALSEVAGGTHMRIPTMADTRRAKARRDHLIALVGPVIAADLITAFAGSVIYIPNGPTPHNARGKAIARKDVRRLRRAGLTITQIARRLRCTERTVYLKLAGKPASTRIAGKDCK